MITSTEVAEQIKRALRGEVSIRLEHPEWTWDGIYAGDVEFLFGDWRIVFFNDCDELDYTDRAETPDGRKADFEDWCRETGAEHSWGCPLRHLSHEETVQLEQMLARAT